MRGGSVDFRILGPLEVVHEARPVRLPRGRGRSLLALLVLHAGEVVSAEWLVDELWGPTPPATANKGLHNLVSDLRRRLQAGDASERAGMLATSGTGYVLRIGPGQVDAHRFRQLVADAEEMPPEQRAARLRAALELWRGPPLADFVYEPFAQAEIAALDELHLTAVEERVEADLALGRHAQLVGELDKLIAAHPYRERLRGQLMLALYRGGRQAEALARYREGREALIDDLGVEPGPALAQLHQATLRQDASLELPQDAAAARTMPTVEQRIQAESWLAAERKTVTVVYADLNLPTSPGGVDAEVTRRVLAQGVDAARDVVERHGGTVEGLIGGVLVVVFGAPIAHEDDALRAVQAAWALREAVQALNRELEPGLGARLALRVGISTGEVIVDEPSTGSAVSGETVNLAAELQQAAAHDEVLVAEPTRRLLGDTARMEAVATLVLDRRSRPATVWRLVDLAGAASARPRVGDQRLIGRTAELARLHAAVQRTVRQGRAGRFLVTGEAGIGKSRLAQELAHTVAAGVRVLRGRCPAHGEGITVWPLREIVLQVAGGPGRDRIAALLAGESDAEPVAAQIAGALASADAAQIGKELFPAVRRLFETLAGRQPLVIIVDDVHWGQPTFLDLVDYLAEAVGAPLLIVCLARPELRDEHPRWMAQGDDAAALALEPLSRGDSEQLVADRLAGRLVPDDVVAQVVELAEGNPLFIEQLLAALRDEGKLEVPPSVRALLAARLDRLGPAERDLLRCAAVIGVEFSLEALVALVPAKARRFLDRHLDALQRKELVRPTRAPLLGEPAFAFRHGLIQQAAYRSITRRVRAQLHERFADWLDQQDAPETDEVVAYHLEQAHAQRHELAPTDDTTRELAERAGRRLADAGLRAYRRFDVAAAENLLARARALLPAAHPLQPEVLRRLAEAYPMLGRLADAEAVVAELLEHHAGAADGPLEQRLRLERLRIRLIAGPDPMRLDAVRREAQRVLAALEPAGDDLGMSQACYVLAMVYLRSGQMEELDAIARRGLTHAQRSGDVREQVGAPWYASWALVAGPTPVADAIRGCEELLRASQGEHIGVLSDLARLEAMVGEFDAAHELAFRARQGAVERFRVRRALTVLALRSAEIEILAGAARTAERTLRRALEVAFDVGERDQTAQIAAQLSLVLATRDRVDDATRYASVAWEHTPTDSLTAQALWRAATARVLTAGDAADEASRLVREAIDLVPADMLNLRADLQAELGQALLAGGRRAAAWSAFEEAAGLYERKGNVVGARQAVAHRSELTTSG